MFGFAKLDVIKTLLALSKAPNLWTLRPKSLLKSTNFPGPACFNFDIKITFDNSDHDGQITIK